MVPEGDDRTRLVCPDCGHVDYVNPRLVVGAVSTWENKFLLAKRAIHPRKGYWTIPAGFLESGETIEAGAVRETWEEARARIRVDRLLGIYNIAKISQVYLVFRAAMLSGDHGPGPESEDARLFSWEEIPWEQLAFPSIRWSLTHFREVAGQDVFVPQTEPPTIHWER